MKPRILFIDDELQWLKLFKQFLEEEQYDVITATNVSDGLQALDKITDLRVIVTDLMLPEEVGEEPEANAGMRLLELIRSKRPDLPIIVLSAYLEPNVKDLRTLGVSAFISKGAPDSIEGIRAHIRKLIEGYGTSVRKEIDESAVLTNLRRALVEEMDKYSPIRERTIYIPEEGSYELIKPLIGFKRDIESQLARFSFSKNVFLMMKFRDSNRELGEYIVETLSNHGLRGVRADHEEWNITKNVYNPIAVLYCCKYGIALFDEPEKHQAYSPNVAYELGMMHYQNKLCLILRHTSLPVVPFDLIKDLYATYDRDLQVRGMISSWIKQVAIKP
ncbi:MAG TPA: response regulator [Pyrinomonadaceae bacterium]